MWSRARRLLVADCERAVAEWHFKPAHCWIVPDAAAASGASRVCLDERRRMVDSPCDPRIYFSAAAACCPQHFAYAPSRWASAIGTIAREMHAAPNIIPVLHGTNGDLIKKPCWNTLVAL